MNKTHIFFLVLLHPDSKILLHFICLYLNNLYFCLNFNITKPEQNEKSFNLDPNRLYISNLFCSKKQC